MYNKPFSLYSNCIVTFGKKKAIIIDLQRGNFYSLSKNVAKIFINKSFKSFNDLIENFDSKNHNKIKELFDYFLKEELLHFPHLKKLFPKLSKEFDYPSKITNCILDFNPRFNYLNLIEELDVFLCNYIQVRVLSISDLYLFTGFISILENTTIWSVELIINVDASITIEILEDLIKINSRISKVNLFINNIKYFNVNENELNKWPITVINNTFNKSYCGKITISYFSVNIKTFTESLHHNSCLKRKISIDAEGNIKNCPSMKESYGNIRDTTLAEAIEKPGFKKYWDINKDKIAVCKDCEFRYICTDCRAYVEEPEDASGPDSTNLSKPLKCGYNPYTGEWAEWSTNPLKQKAIDFYGMREMVTNINSASEDLVK